MKAAAGEPNVGAKVQKPVYHFVLTWSETDQVNNEMQQEAVTGALKSLGLENHQALAIQHTDGKPHAHVMVNLVNPENGTVPKLSYTKKALRKFANEFEEKHGLEITEGSRDNAIKRQNGEQVDARRKSRPVYEQEKREGQNPRLKWLRNQEGQIAKNLQLEGKEMQQQHSTQWDALRESYATGKAERGTAKQADIQAAIDDVKASFKLKWAALFKQNRDNTKQFDAAEKSPVAKVFNMGRTFLAARKDGQNMPNSFTAAAVKSDREIYLSINPNQKKEKALSAELKSKIGDEVSRVKRRHSASESKSRNSYLDECKALSAEQKQERKAQQKKWREYNQRRQENFQQISTQEQGQLQQQSYGYGNHLIEIRKTRNPLRMK
ncbi:MAG: relaxase/mobilization nuclease domain-containing protein [Gammaproteobacteria bacterium]|nr:relaxase/mobilization nuclease domain-containing protein [Gammaproteobacteria bacterium]